MLVEFVDETEGLTAHPTKVNAAGREASGLVKTDSLYQLVPWRNNVTMRGEMSAFHYILGAQSAYREYIWSVQLYRNI